MKKHTKHNFFQRCTELHQRDLVVPYCYTFFSLMTNFQEKQVNWHWFKIFKNRGTFGEYP